jgi:hypothetical protein
MCGVTDEHNEAIGVGAFCDSKRKCLTAINTSVMKPT